MSPSHWGFVALETAPMSLLARRTLLKVDYQARGVMYIPAAARWSNLMTLPEGANIGKSINAVMRLIE